jgi:hypothetical protein
VSVASGVSSFESSPLVIRWATQGAMSLA